MILFTLRETMREKHLYSQDVYIIQYVDVRQTLADMKLIACLCILEIY